MKPEDKVITIGDRKVFYSEKRHDQEKVIVLLHGYPGNYDELMDFANSFGEKYRIIMPNFPSCGGSEPLKEKHNLKNYVEWLKLFLDTLSIHQAVIIGHSFGARVALGLSVNYPQKVARLILITPVLRADSLFAYPIWLKYEIAKLMSPPTRKAFLSIKLYEYVACKIVLKSKNSDQHKKIMAKGVRELKHIHPSAHIDLFEEFYKLDLTGLGKKVKAISLIIAGEKDYVATIKSIKELANQMSEVSLEIMKDAGHLLPFESPQATAGIIESWLENE